MRINLYEEELTDEVALVSTTASNTGITYYGVRCYLKSPDDLHHSAKDDDRSAVTFWVGKQHRAEALVNLLKEGLTNALKPVGLGSVLNDVYDSDNP